MWFEPHRNKWDAWELPHRMPVMATSKNSDIEGAYPFIKRVADGELGLTAAVNQIAQKFGMNRNSAREFVENFRTMVKGEQYERKYTLFGRIRRSVEAESPYDHQRNAKRRRAAPDVA
jgi:hypothetical protein